MHEQPDNNHLLIPSFTRPDLWRWYYVGHDIFVSHSKNKRGKGQGSEGDISTKAGRCWTAASQWTDNECAALHIAFHKSEHLAEMLPASCIISKNNIGIKYAAPLSVTHEDIQKKAFSLDKIWNKFFMVMNKMMKVTTPKVAFPEERLDGNSYKHIRMLKLLLLISFLLRGVHSRAMVSLCKLL